MVLRDRGRLAAVRAARAAAAQTYFSQHAAQWDRIRRLHVAVSRYAGLPLDRTKSDAEALALVLLREAARSPRLVNETLAGEEADLIWPDWGLIVELDGPQFHLDASEDLRKQQVWEAAGWTVRLLPTDDVYLHPDRLLALATPPDGAERR